MTMKVGSQREAPFSQKEVDFECSLPKSFIELLGGQIVGVGAVQMLITTSHIDINQLGLGDFELQCDWCTQVSVWLCRGYPKAHSSVTLNHCPTADPRLQVSTRVLGLGPLTDHCLQHLTSVSGTNNLWTSDSRHSLSWSSISSHTVTFYQLPVTLSNYMSRYKPSQHCIESTVRQGCSKFF